MLNTVSIIKQNKCITSAPIIIQLQKDVDSFTGISQFWTVVTECKYQQMQGDENSNILLDLIFFELSVNNSMLYPMRKALAS